MSPILPQPDEKVPVTLVLETEHLNLRRFERSDAERLVEVLNDPKIAATTLHMPSPYRMADAEQFIFSSRKTWTDGSDVVCAIILREEKRLIGVIGLTSEPPYQRAELGYSIAVPYWGRGYATEAATRMVQFGFEVLGLNRIYAGHYPHNPASGRVLQKAGLIYEGTLRQHYVRFGNFYDGVTYGILRSDWEARP